MSATMTPKNNQITPDDIVAYVMNNPENTNPAVLRDLIQTMLDSNKEPEPAPEDEV